MGNLVASNFKSLWYFSLSFSFSVVSLDLIIWKSGGYYLSKLFYNSCLYFSYSSLESSTWLHLAFSSWKAFSWCVFSNQFILDLFIFSLISESLCLLSFPKQVFWNSVFILHHSPILKNVEFCDFSDIYNYYQNQFKNWLWIWLKISLSP